MLLKNNCSTDRITQGFSVGLIGLAVICAAVCLMPTAVGAQAKVGTTGAQFLELGVSARAMGMAEAFTAIVDDVTAVYYNPAGLTSLYTKQTAFTYINMPADINYGFASFGLPLETIGGVMGIGMYALSSGEMIERTMTSGEYEGTGRTFGWNDFALSVSYGRYLTDRFSIGFTARYIGEFCHDYSANGWSADIGTFYDTGHRGFRIAMVITNFGPDMTMDSKPYPLPINFKFGGSINVVENTYHLVSFAAEGSHPSDNLEKYNTGLEYVYNDRFILRAGHRFNYDVDGFAVGGGLRFPLGEDREIRCDYAFQDFGILTQVHRFTLLTAF